MATESTRNKPFKPAENEKEHILTRTERYFVFCGECKETTAVDFEVRIFKYIYRYMDRGELKAVEDTWIECYRIEGITLIEVENTYVNQCPRCGAKLVFRNTSKPSSRSELKAKKSTQPCGLSCHNAVSATCLCSCEGKNHGVAHQLNV